MSLICKNHGWITRIVVGTWCLWFFLQLELSEGGIALIADRNFPGMSRAISSVAIAGVASSLWFALGYGIRASSIVMWLGMLAVLVAVPPLRETTYPYIFMILALYALFYEGKGMFDREGKLAGERLWFWPLAIAIYAGFTVAGLSKLFFDQWRSGWVIGHLCVGSPLAYVAGKSICTYVPSQLLAYLVIGIEALALPLFLVPKTRALAWGLNTLLHLSVLFFVWIWPVSLGILVVQLFLLLAPTERKIYFGN